MSEYFLADIRAREREKRREQELDLRNATQEPKQAQDMKITLLGDFLFPTSEAQGCDPYNAPTGVRRAKLGGRGAIAADLRGAAPAPESSHFATAARLRSRAARNSLSAFQFGKVFSPASLAPTAYSSARSSAPAAQVRVR